MVQWEETRTKGKKPTMKAKWRATKKWAKEAPMWSIRQTEGAIITTKCQDATASTAGWRRKSFGSARHSWTEGASSAPLFQRKNMGGTRDPTTEGGSPVPFHTRTKNIESARDSWTEGGSHVPLFYSRRKTAWSIHAQWCLWHSREQVRTRQYNLNAVEDWSRTTMVITVCLSRTSYEMSHIHALLMDHEEWVMSDFVPDVMMKYHMRSEEARTEGLQICLCCRKHLARTLQGEVPASNAKYHR